MNNVMAEMKQRLANGLDPLTGEKMQTVGVITWRAGILCDETGREVTLNSNGTWIYKQWK